ncbi:hypothetical protein [Sneathiella chinensis]|uniref:Ribbon-helix-helix protein CopG domain-containing protein n=1 Tax=Sneathiella chinensis TaxID=349750 RepID=A0ABQ5U5I5_9PROT|nr:hypothetical protein [Sneathiella chinensis]GLQ07425.1 hypothetical protein GCM10007924_26460 [Sneathiella chinensis]
MKAAFLSSSLISAKGRAAPATPVMSPESVLARAAGLRKPVTSPALQSPVQGATPVARDQGRTTRPVAASRQPEAPRPAPVSEPAAKPEAHDNREVELLARKTRKLKRDTLGRVRLGIRMTPEQHLQLKVIAAHAHMSVQTLMEQALDEFIDNHGDELAPSACACVREKKFRL